MHPHGGGAQVERDEGQIVQPAHQIFGIKIVEPPERCHCVQRMCRARLKDCQLGASTLVVRSQQIETRADRSHHRVFASRRRLAVERRDTALVERAAYVRHRARDRVAALDPLAHRRAGKRDWERPFTQAFDQTLARFRVRRRRTRARNEQRQRIGRAHAIDIDSPGIGCEIEPARGDQPRAAAAALQEGPEVRRLPHIVDDHQAVLALESKRQLASGIFDVDKPRPIARECGVQLDQLIEQVRIHPMLPRECRRRTRRVCDRRDRVQLPSVVFPNPPGPRSVTATPAGSRPSRCQQRKLLALLRAGD